MAARAGDGLIQVKRPVGIVLVAGVVAALALVATSLVQVAAGITEVRHFWGVTLAGLVPVALGLWIAYRYALRGHAESSSLSKRLDAIVDSAMDAIITVDESQHVVYFNHAAEQMFGLRRDQALGAPLDRFIPQRFREMHRRHVEEFGRTGVTSRRMGAAPTLWALRAD